MRAERGQRPDVSTDQGRLDFIKILNTSLPKKRTIAQGVLRNEHGELLLCQLTYKREWDLPGGVVDPDLCPARSARGARHRGQRRRPAGGQLAAALARVG